MILTTWMLIQSQETVILITGLSFTYLWIFFFASFRVFNFRDWDWAISEGNALKPSPIYIVCVDLRLNNLS